MKKAASIQPKIPPIERLIQERLCKFSDPLLGSFLAWETIIASMTTSVMAVKREFKKSNAVIGFSLWNRPVARVIRLRNWQIPLRMT